MYFGQGSVGLQGVVVPEGFTVDLAKHPHAHDVPGQDVTLTGDTVWARDPRLPFPYYAETGPFQPYLARDQAVREGNMVDGVDVADPEGAEPAAIEGPYLLNLHGETWDVHLDAMGAFAIAEQLGLALAHHELRDLAFAVEAEKSTDQLILKELMLEMAAVSILYGEQV
ncbi:hypothetical protein [Sorangium sp. So ce131]|uniref:hypothetical protein n=1 Tax=Sorangium sp. So ce131 TaxID=3133282 RepID=UPI003F600C64